MAHKDIRIRFEVNGRKFEAVGFLREGEERVKGDEMLSRAAGENNGAIGDEDEAFLREHCNKLPVELRKHCLVTNRRNFNYPRDLSCFYWSDNTQKWFQYGNNLGYGWYDNCLVVRRVA